MPAETSDVNRIDLVGEDATGDDEGDEEEDISEDDGGHNNPGVNPDDRTDFIMADADGVEDTSMQHRSRPGQLNPNAAQVQMPANQLPVPGRDGPSVACEGTMGAGVVTTEDQRRRQTAQAQGRAGQQQRTNNGAVAGGNNDGELNEMDDEPPLDGYER